MFNSREQGNRQRVILHCDLNNFFASVACHKNPALRGKPVAVCGNPKLRKGIVLAKSEVAKKQGVKTGMAIWQARQVCPDLVVVPTDYPAYNYYSQKVQAIYYRFTNQVESFGIDECWLDVTHSQKLFGDGVAIADQIRTAVKRELGLTISVGVSFNKTYAKLGSDLAAPDAVTVIDLSNYQQIVYPLPLGNLLFVGKQTQKQLAKMNITTIGALAQVDPQWLQTIMGINALKLVAAARGEDYSEVTDFHHRELPKSVGNGTTLPMDLTTHRAVEQVIYLLAEKVAYRLRQQNLSGYTVSLSIKGTDLQWVGAQQTLPHATNTVPTIRQAAVAIFDKLWGQGQANVTPVRALRVAVSQVTNHPTDQMTLFADADQEAKQQTLAKVFDQVRQKYGTDHILLGGTPATYEKLGYKLDFYECDDLSADDGKNLFDNH